MLGFSAAAMNAYQNGSPSALDGEAEQTRDLPTADLATGLVINRPPTGGDLTFSWKKGHI